MNWRERFLQLYPGVMPKSCDVCGREGIIAGVLGVCIDCIYNTQEAESFIRKAHSNIRSRYGVPSGGNSRCNLCVNRCLMKDGVGLCNVKKSEVELDYYYDQLPTNCVAEWVCAATGRGYPCFSYTPRVEIGYYNLAVFYNSCTFNCIFCQNWHFRFSSGKKISPSELADKIRDNTACICFFGGDPTAFIWHSIRTCEIVKEKFPRKIVRFCWETNGSLNPKIMEKIAYLALESGGTVKIDFKAYHDRLHLALTGSSNEYTRENVKILADIARKRKELPLLVVSTLVVPGYITPDEIENIAKIVADINPDVPYSLLAFYPQFYADDLPRTSKKHMDICVDAAFSAGLKHVHVGNKHLLW